MKREQAAAKKQVDIEAQARALQDVAQIEDAQLREDERREYSRRTGKNGASILRLYGPGETQELTYTYSPFMLRG